jgi:phage-related minor tail protein
MKNLSEDLKRIQDDARHEEEIRAEKEKQEIAQKEKKDLKRHRQLAEDQYDDYLQNLKDAAHESPDSKKLTVSISGCGPAGYQIGQRLVELFKEEGMRVALHSDTIENYYESGVDVTHHRLGFEL